MAEFANANKKLETLDLGENVLQDFAAENLAAANCLSELKIHRLDRRPRLRMKASVDFRLGSATPTNPALCCSLSDR